MPRKYKLKIISYLKLLFSIIVGRRSSHQQQHRHHHRRRHQQPIPQLIHIVIDNASSKIKFSITSKGYVLIDFIIINKSYHYEIEPILFL